MQENQTNTQTGVAPSNVYFAAIALTHWKSLVAITILGGALGLASSYLIPPTYTATTSFIPPQPQQSGAAAALASLGSLSSLVGGGAVKSSGDQFVSLLQSVRVSDRIIDRFKLMQDYDVDLWFKARKELAKNVRINLGKKDGIISIEVDASSPQMAADMANQYVDELRRLNSELALTEAQQRRVFFETQLKKTKSDLADAQAQLENSGVNGGAIKAEPKAAADIYAKLKAELTTAQIKLQAMRSNLSDTSAEVKQQMSVIAALDSELNRTEGPGQNDASNKSKGEYISKYRDYKYQENLFELFSKQYELARLDESRESPVIQVIDVAQAPERKSKPKRSLIAIGCAFMAFLTSSAWLTYRRIRTR